MRGERLLIGSSEVVFLRDTPLSWEEPVIELATFQFKINPLYLLS